MVVFELIHFPSLTKHKILNTIIVLRHYSKAFSACTNGIIKVEGINRAAQRDNAFHG